MDNLEFVDHIPVIWEEPHGGGNGSLVVWLPGLSGRKENHRRELKLFAEAGFTAVSFDPYEHGDRAKEDREAFFKKLDSNKRRYFWPMIAMTAEEYPRIVDWAVERFGLSGPVMAGGVSMGGDIAVAAAAIDHRIAAVAACVATPDWLRPGSDEAPCTPDRYAWNCYDRCNPLTNIGKYAHTPAILFLNGAHDGHVPPDGAHRFQSALSELYAARPERYAIKEYEVGHECPEEMTQDALAWFIQHTKDGGGQR